MKFTLRHKQLGDKLSITTNSNDPDEQVKPVYPNSRLSESLALYLEGATGLRGHKFNPTLTTNADCAIAFGQLEDFSLVSIEPPLKKPEEIPKGAQS